MRDLSGTGQVYCFTLSQLLKSNANRITLLLMVLLAAVSMPLTALMRGESPEVSDTSSLTAVRLENRTLWTWIFPEIPTGRIRSFPPAQRTPTPWSLSAVTSPAIRWR